MLTCFHECCQKKAKHKPFSWSCVAGTADSFHRRKMTCAGDCAASTEWRVQVWCLWGDQLQCRPCKAHLGWHLNAVGVLVWLYHCHPSQVSFACVSRQLFLLHKTACRQPLPDILCNDYPGTRVSALCTQLLCTPNIASDAPFSHPASAGTTRRPCWVIWRLFCWVSKLAWSSSRWTRTDCNTSLSRSVLCDHTSRKQ